MKHDVSGVHDAGVVHRTGLHPVVALGAVEQHQVSIGVHTDVGAGGSVD